MHEENPLFGNARVNDFPAMAVDKSTGGHRGRIYVVVPVKENGNGKAVIQISWSDNQGATWSALKTISIANGRQNWFPWVTVDATNGNVYVIYSLDAANGFATNTYVAISNDGGATFINQRVSDVAHTTAPIAGFMDGYCGDYIGITSYNGRAYAAWCDNRTGQWQDYVSQVSNSDISGSDYFCTGNSTYKVTNLPTNSTINWTVSPSGIVTPNSCTNCNQITLTKVSGGTITLNASIINACGTTSLVLSKPITIGNPPPIGTSSDNSNCSSHYFDYLVTSLSEYCTANTTIGFNYNITDSRYSNFVYTPVSVPSGATWGVSGSNLFMSVTTPPSQGSVSETIALSATGPCGTYNVNFTSTAANIYSSLFAVSPNPSQGDVTVSMDNQNLSKNNSGNLILQLK